MRKIGISDFSIKPTNSFLVIPDLIGNLYISFSILLFIAHTIEKWYNKSYLIIDFIIKNEIGGLNYLCFM